MKKEENEKLQATIVSEEKLKDVTGGTNAIAWICQKCSTPSYNFKEDICKKCGHPRDNLIDNLFDNPVFVNPVDNLISNPVDNPVFANPVDLV